MIRRAAKGTSWSQFVDYASPALFEVMPMRALVAQGKEFISNGRKAERFAEARSQVQSVLRERQVAIELDGEERGRPLTDSELTDPEKRAAGDRILELYFAQVFGGDVAILDLRTESFGLTDRGALTWRPRAFYVHWDPEFLDGLRNLYAGFYLDDDARFARGLTELRLEDSGDALRSHLGSGDQRSVRFETSAFHSSFHDTFISCRESGVALHRNFLALGVYLVCLYDVLETLGLEFDVRRAFEHAH